MPRIFHPRAPQALIARRTGGTLTIVRSRPAQAAALAACLLLCSAGPAASQDGGVTVAQRTAGLKRHDGLVPFYAGGRDGKLLLELSASGQEVLYLVSLSSGASWPVERGASHDRPPMVVRFERRGPRVLLLVLDPRHRATGADSAPLLRMAADVFPPAVLWSFPIAGEEGNRLVVDATDFVMRDAFHVVHNLREASKTAFRLDAARSFVVPERSNAFSRNTELETTLTFAADQPSSAAGIARTPDSHTISINQRHSFIALPDGEYRPRAVDSRLGLSPLVLHDLSGTYTSDYSRQFVHRFRLRKRDPSAELSEPVQPIAVYLEEGIPGEYRDAVRRGALYWNRVFESAGYRNAVRVEDLPPGADPLDIRYRVVVLWSPGTARKTSHAVPISDPRTGELLKSYIRLDAYRSLEDYNRYAAMAPALASSQPDAASYIMARRRWLTAHEMGHAIGSLMHYTLAPSQLGFRLPVVEPSGDGRLTLDLSRGDVTDPLPYDQLVIKYLYTELPTADEERGLRAIVDDGLRRRLWFIHDDIRANPRALSRLGGSDALTELARERAVRRIMLRNFGATVLRPGEPMSLLHDRLIPAYFEHRLAIQAAAKAIGGAEFLSAVRGDSAEPFRIVSPTYQRRALAALLELLSPGELAIPERIAALIPPRLSPTPASVFDGSAEPGVFVYLTGEAGSIRIPASPTGVFDPLAWARALADIISGEILGPDRSARVVALHARDPRSPSLDEVIAQVLAATWYAPAPGEPGAAGLHRVAQWSVLQRLLALAQDGRSRPEARASATGALSVLLKRLVAMKLADPPTLGHRALAAREIKKLLDGR